MADPVGLGIVGLGRGAGAHAAASARSETVQIVNGYSRTAETRAAFAAAHGLDRTAGSFEELLADRDVEALIVSTPNDVHAAQVVAAARAGKPVLVDKPLSVDVAEGLDLVRAVTAAGVPVGVAHHARRLAGHRAARAWIESGDAGKVRLAHGDFSNNRGAVMKRDAWHRTARGFDGGVLIQVGIHQVDVMLYLLGPVVTVNARFEYEALGREMPDAAAVTLRHASGALSVVTCSWTTPSHYRTDLLATGGNLSFRLEHRNWPSGNIDDYGELILDPADGDRGPLAVTKGDPLRDQLEELGRAARDGSPMSVDAVAGLRAVAVVEASVGSAREQGATVAIEDLVREAGGDDTEVAMVVAP